MNTFTIRNYRKAATDNSISATSAPPPSGGDDDDTTTTTSITRAPILSIRKRLGSRYNRKERDMLLDDIGVVHGDKEQVQQQQQQQGQQRTIDRYSSKDNDDDDDEEEEEEQGEEAENDASHHDGEDGTYDDEEQGDSQERNENIRQKAGSGEKHNQKNTKEERIRQKGKREKSRKKLPNGQRKRLVFTSPRLISDDDDLFFAKPNSPSYQDSTKRWEKISSQAASHQQDGSRLTIRAKLSPAVLRNGLTNEARRRIEHVSLCVDEDTVVPTWLDELSSAEDFPNLKHLTFIECEFPDEEKMAASARMRRLYVLYRLPNLLSIDGQDVTNDERRLARPNDPILICNKETQDDEGSTQDGDEDNDNGNDEDKTTNGATDRRDDDEGAEDFGIQPTLSGNVISEPPDLRHTDLSVKPEEEVNKEMSNLELASVASTDIEWSAACGVLLFSSDRSCAPRLRMPFSRGTRKTHVAPEEDIRSRLVQKVIATPQAGCCNVLPSRKRISASESLSSPFPREFRERHIAARSKANSQKLASSTTVVRKNELDDSTSSSENRTLKSINENQQDSHTPSLRPDLPPPCPRNSQKQRVSSTIQNNKTKGRIRQRQRQISVMDMDSDEDEED